MSAFFSHTLVPVDGSKLAETALEAVGPLVRAQHGEVILTMVLDAAVDRGLSSYAEVEGVPVVEAAETYLRTLSEEMHSRGVACRYRLVFEPNAAQGILDVAGDEPVSAIAMASHGRSGVGRWLLGSVAEKIVRSAHIPTIVIPAR